MEVELKLTLDPADNDQLLHHPLIAAHARAPLRRDRLSARYFDTPDLHLLRQGAGLRVRKMDGAWIQTMKAGGGVQSGLHQRNEWEGEVSRPWPQLGKLRKLMDHDGDWRAALDAPQLKQRLEALFAVEVERSTWQLRVDGSAIELVLDHGQIDRHGQHVPVNEIELELKSGEPASLFAFALQLLEQIPMRVSNTNKAQRGYALVRQTGTVPVKAKTLRLDGADRAAAGLLAILGNCLEHIQDNEDAVIGGDNAESLHQLRVGVRRLRSALKLFGDIAPCPPEILQDSAWLGAELGAARDWEVLMISTLPRVGAAPGGKVGLMELQQLVLARARAQRQAAAQALLSTRYTRLLLSLGLWMQRLDAGAGDGDANTVALADFARQAMRTLHKKLRKRAARIADGDTRAVHRLRIAGKRARYALEFFQSLQRPRGAERYLDTLSTLQDELGQHNDLQVASQLLDSLLEQRPDAAGVVGFVRGYLLAQQEQQAGAIAASRRTVRALVLPRPA